MKYLKNLISILDPANSATLAAKAGTVAVVLGSLIALLTQIQKMLCAVVPCVTP